MARISLSRVVKVHGSTPITLEEFADVVGTTPAVLRGRRDRDADFPVPITSEATPLIYPLRDLITWWSDRESIESIAVDGVALARWAFTASFERCSRAHGADATRRLIAGAALLLCHRWPLVRRIAETELLPGLRAYVTTLEPEFPEMQRRIEDFHPDAIPATDREFLTTLLSWSRTRSYTPRVPDQSPTAGRLLADLLQLRDAVQDSLPIGTRSDRDALNLPLIEVIEPLVRGLSRDITTRPSTSDLGLTRLMVTIVDPRPGEVIVDLACGQGETFVEATRTTRSTDSASQVIGCIGRERDELVWMIAKVRLGLRDIAHDLGRPSDGVDCKFHARPNHRFISDPGMRIPQLRKWTRRHLELLDADGVAVLAVPAAAVFRPNPGRWWTEVQGQIDSVVFTPTDIAVIVLRSQAPVWKSLVQIHRMTAAMAERRYREHAESTGVAVTDEVPIDVVDPAIEPFMPTQIRRVAEQISGRAASGSTDRKPSEGEDDFVQWRPIRALTLEALGEPRFGDCSSIRDAVPVPEPEPAPTQQPVVPTDPPEPRRRSSRDRVVFAALRAAEKDDNTGEAAIARQARELEAQALEAVRVLRWLLDPTTLHERAKNGPANRKVNGSLSPKTNGALEELGTEEMRRALRRLELRLLGEETRGRRPKDETE
jgi:hypothetical protein